jgi:hypothetical protein
MIYILPTRNYTLSAPRFCVLVFWGDLIAGPAEQLRHYACQQLHDQVQSSLTTTHRLLTMYDITSLESLSLCL